ncbi:zf-HC2 domain-containing protein [bacterium]|nr:zf-HC2 domain-containing protein [bacterium]RQV96627.1 MAG: zf-HC2 domain-containing protein [bacterium]
MNCRTCQKWLHLYGEGELSSLQRRKIIHHLQSCSRCQSVSERIELFKQSVGTFNKTTPEMDQLEFSMNQVMDSIQRHEKKSRQRSGLDRWMWLTRPAVQMATVCLLFIMISSFFVQESVMINRVANLEGKIEGSVSMPKSTWSQYLSTIREFENNLFNGDAEKVFNQIMNNEIHGQTLTQYTMRFFQLSPSQQFKIIRFYRSVQDLYPIPKSTIRSIENAYWQNKIRF